MGTKHRPYGPPNVASEERERQHKPLDDMEVQEMDFFFRHLQHLPQQYWYFYSC